LKPIILQRKKDPLLEIPGAVSLLQGCGPVCDLGSGLAHADLPVPHAPLKLLPDGSVEAVVSQATALGEQEKDQHGQPVH
jgi:hypothetical protein